MISESAYEPSSRRLKSIITRCSSETSCDRVVKSVITRCSSKRPNPDLNPTPKSKKSRRSSVDLGDLLFTRDRDFLVRNNGQKVSARRLKGKSVVLFIVRIDSGGFIEAGETLDVVQAYHELLPLGGTEFVFVPVTLPVTSDHAQYGDNDYASQEARFNNLFSSLPFPSVPLSDLEACGDRVVNAFSVGQCLFSPLPYWVIVDPTGTVVATRAQFHQPFKLFGGAELYPLSRHRICTLYNDFTYGDRLEIRKQLIRKWDQLLASPTRDYLLSSNGGRVPISSLRGKLIGLYFCDNVPCPPRMDVIKEAYRQAKSCGYDFEIVQINFHYRFCYASARYADDALFSKQQHYENINWLTLPFKDPCCRKLQRILKCQVEDDEPVFTGDCLVIVDPRQTTDEVVFEFAGAEVIKEYGIEAYPFTRPSIFETEFTRLKREVKLHFLFPPGLCQFTTRHDTVNDSPLNGKRVIVLFVKPSKFKYDTFIPMLKTKYREQAHEDKFEVVYVSIGDCKSEFVQDMPWLVHPHSHEFGTWWRSKIFKMYGEIEAAAFGTDGELIAKENLECWQGWEPEQILEDRFPFFAQQDLRQSIQEEAELICDFDWYYSRPLTINPGSPYTYSI